MSKSRTGPSPFERRFLDAPVRLTVIGSGEIGGKARGLARLQEILSTRLDAARFPWAEVDIPSLSVLATDVFDAFLDRNGLQDALGPDTPDDRIAHAFQRASLPAEVVGDLKALVDGVRQPLAVRSSSLLEDALDRPLAGVYETKMIPNNQPERDARFQRLVEAIKFVYASTFWRAARDYRRAAGLEARPEKMAVVLQEVIGARRGDRFYPQVSGVARSFNFFPAGSARPEQGVVHLALGLGKTIVDGGMAWCYSPALPRSSPPFASPRDLLHNTQTRFWAVHMGRPPAYDPMAETEFLVQGDLEDAERDGSLPLLASTYDAAADRLIPGLGREGPRAITFAPLLVLREYPLADLVQEVMTSCEAALGGPVELEFALELPARRDGKVRLGLLQVRPMVGPDERIEIPREALDADDVLLASGRSMGNGCVEEVRDVVYVKPGSFEARHSREIGAEVARLNASLREDGRPYLLIGFGRWGSVDPWLGIPVDWAQIAGAAAIVEATLPQMNVEPSQGSHFFHNLSASGVLYLHVHHETDRAIDWRWLESRPAETELRFVRHVRIERPLQILVDGRCGVGIVRWGAE